ncbi:hypothetical protein ACF1CG_36905 [Streptomyces sp. NPDC014773]|uniref:hypothetical protein n=1 Tax=Streptomyces sp. NPDC014773 TaxID=3364908 RepID=UPI003701AF75
MISMARPQAGVIDDIERDDDARGYEPEARLTQLHGLVRHLTADGDRRAALAGRQAPRTLAQMAGRLR